MNTTQLECFLAVAETLNFSKAAEMVNISQPAVSHQISSLEAELGVRLFLRTNKSVQLTKEGLIFIGDAETIVRTAMNSIHRLSTNVKEKKRTVAIGVHNQYELDAAVPVMNIIGKMYPNFEPEITMMRSNRLIICSRKTSCRSYSLSRLKTKPQKQSALPNCASVRLCCYAEKTMN